MALKLCSLVPMDHAILIHCHAAAEVLHVKITSVSMNRPLNKAQGAVKKISPLVKPSHMAVREVHAEEPVNDTEAYSSDSLRKGQRKTTLDGLGNEVDVWV